jgi:hypothetical protein
MTNKKLKTFTSAEVVTLIAKALSEATKTNYFEGNMHQKAEFLWNFSVDNNIDQVLL